MHFKKLTSGIIALAMTLSIVPAPAFAADTVRLNLYSDDFESYDVSVYPKPKPDGITVSGSGDEVYVDTVGSSKRLWLKNDGFVSDVQIKKSFSKVTGKTVMFELDFLQLYNTSEGDTILGVYSGETPIALIQSKDGDIVYKTSESTAVLVSDYSANKEYSIKTEVDLFENEAEIWVEGDSVGSYSLLSSAGTADNFRIVSKQLPGFTVDNLKVYTVESLDKVTVTGDSSPVIPVYDSAEYEYSAAVFDSNGTESENAELKWTLSGAPSGVSLVSDSGKKVKIKVTNAAAEGTFTLTARIPDSDVSGSITLKTVPLSASSLKIEGWQDKVEIRSKDGGKSYVAYPSYRVTAEEGESKEYEFKAVVLDQFGNEVENFGKINWSLFIPESESKLPDGVSIDSRSGIVTVSKAPEEEQLIGIRAVSADDSSIKGETKISVLDFETYAMDRTRMNSVIEHVESTLDGATLDSSVLISDVFDRGSRTPVRILESTKDTIESNVMSESNLMRAMYNLSVITGDSKYSDRVNSIYKLLMTDGLVNGVKMSWGGHMTMDMETNLPYATYNSGTHEIKGVSPFISPMFSEDVNEEYTEDSYNNGYGLAGWLFRAIVAGHAMGDYKNLDFERHWNATSYASAFESVWKTPDAFDKDRRGPLQRSGGAAFTGALGNIIECLLEYYTATGDENGLSWAANYVDTLLNSSMTYYVYKDTNGEYIWPSDTTNMKYWKDSSGEGGEEPKREYYNNKNELAYISVKSDIRELSANQYSANFIYQHRDLAETDVSGNVTDTVKVIDVKTGTPTELTLYNTWTDGSWGEPATTAGCNYLLEKVTDSLGYQWYEYPSLDNYTGPPYGDRLYANLVMGTDDPSDKDTWIELGYITEEEGSLMIDPYSRMRGMETLDGILLAICEAIDKLYDADRSDEATELLEKASKGVYSSLKLRYAFDTDNYLSYMTWIRPDYMRSHNIVDYEEVPWDVELNDNLTEKNKKYLRTEKSMGAGHKGYYYAKGSTFYEKRIEPQHLSSLSKLCSILRENVEKLEATDPSDPNYDSNMEKAELFSNRIKYFWKVLRDMCFGKVPIGDIGEDFWNLEPDLNFGTSSDSYMMIETSINMYRATGHKDFLKLARAIANNFMRTNYSANEQIFVTGSDYFTSSSNDILPILLELDALLLDRYDENIKYTVAYRGAEFYDTYTYGKDDSYRQNKDFTNTPQTLYANDVVEVQKIRINHSTIELKVGECVQIDYDIIPYDAENQDVYWDVYDQRVAMMDTDTDTLYALKKGKTKIRCASKSKLGVASEEVEVIVR